MFLSRVCIAIFHEKRNASKTDSSTLMHREKIHINYYYNKFEIDAKEYAI